MGEDHRHHRRPRGGRRSKSSSSSKYCYSASSSSSSSSSFSQSNFYRKPDRSSTPSDYSSRNKSWDEPTGTINQKVDDGEEDPPAIVGTCPFMCPVEERARRERLRDLAVFERLDGNPGKTSSGLAVKKFCRTLSTKHMQASDIRPLPVLEGTLSYLLTLVDSKGYQFDAVHEFIFDRARSIRQDLSIQNINGDEVIRIYEKIVKFYIISHRRLHSISGSSEISPMHYLNLEQLQKTLSSLFSLYATNRKSNSANENEAEFHSFYMLLHLGSDSLAMGGSLSVWFSRVPMSILKSKEMIFARRLLRG